MRRMLVVCVAALSAIFTPPAMAALPAGVPGAWCSTETPSACYTYQDGDEFLESVSAYDQWAFIKATTGQHGRSSSALGCSTVAYPPMVTSTGCNAMRARIVTYRLSRKHAYNWKYPWFVAEYLVLRFDDSFEYVDPSYQRSVLSYAGHNHPLCGYPFESPYTLIVDREQVPKPDAPAEYVAYCFHDLSSGTTTPPATPEPTTDPTTTAPPASVTKPTNCHAISVPVEGRVGVMASHTNCGVAHGLLRTYLRTDKNPRGWSCVSISFAKMNRAKCVRLGRARAEVVGTWRR